MCRYVRMLDVCMVVALLSMTTTTFMNRCCNNSFTDAYTTTLTTSTFIQHQQYRKIHHQHQDFVSRRGRIRCHAIPAKQSRSSKQNDFTRTTTVDDETPAGIVGAQFFGGNKEKEIFYDPIAEMEAGIMEPTTTTAVTTTATTLTTATTTTTYDRFADRTAFPDTNIASIAESLQDQINHVLYSDETIRTATTTIPLQYTYASNVRWETVFPKTTSTTSTPLLELETALNFYRRINVAIICGNTVTSEASTSPTPSTLKPSSSKTTTLVQLRWEISVLWPTLWEPRIVLTGSSVLTINTDTKQIIQQTDTLDDSDLFRTILQQYLPRFWDVYHIGMTPAAEVAPIIPIPKKWTTFLTLHNSYKLQVLPPRIVVQATINDSNDRDDNNASILPNHAFTCVIKTMGPEKQFYTPTTGVQVRLIPNNNNNNNNNNNRLQIQWNIPMATEYVSNPILSLPPPLLDSNKINIDSEYAEFTPEDMDVLQPTCHYTYLPRRFVATIPYGGTPQDTDITKVRKQLYDQIIRDGYQPKMDQRNQRPIFFFTMNSVKACYTNEGLGMAVYEWRPQFTKPNEIGIELEII